MGIFAALGLPLIGKRQSPKSVCLQQTSLEELLQRNVQQVLSALRGSGFVGSRPN